MTGVGEVGSSMVRTEKEKRKLSTADKDVVHGDVDCHCVSEMCRVRVENQESSPSLTMKPIPPMTRKPTPTAWLILMNSRRSARHWLSD